MDWTWACEEWCEEAHIKSHIKSCGIYYVVDVNLHVHICSFQPNLEAWPMCAYVTFDSEEAADADEGNAELELMNSEGHHCSYFGTEIAAMPSQPLSKYIHIPEQEPDESDEDWRMRVAEEAREHFAGNPCGF